MILWLWTALLSGLALRAGVHERGQRAGAARRDGARAAAVRLVLPRPPRRPGRLRARPAGGRAARARPTRRSRPRRTWWTSRAAAGAPDEGAAAGRHLRAFGLTLVESPGSLRIHSQAGPSRAARHRDSARPVGVDRGWNSEASGRKPRRWIQRRAQPGAEPGGRPRALRIPRLSARPGARHRPALPRWRSGSSAFLGAVLALYFRYQAAMAKEEADKPWNRRQW